MTPMRTANPVHAAHALAAALRGDSEDSTVRPTSGCRLPAPTAGWTEMVRLGGLRRREEGETIWPDPGWLAAIHATPSLRALMSVVDIDRGEVAWRIAAGEGLALDAVLGAVFGRDRVWREPRPAVARPLEAALVGLPQPVLPDPDQPAPAGLDRVIDALSTEQATLAVIATPEPDEEIAGLLHRIDGHLSMLATLDEADGRRADIQSTRDTLEAHHRYLSAARPTGLWRAAVVVRAATEEALQTAIGAWSSAVGQHPEGLRPLRPARTHPRSTRVPTETLYDAATLARWMQPPQRDRVGFEIVDEPPFHLHPPPPAPRSITLGRALVQGATTAQRIDLDLDRLTRHALVCGITGSGKTHTVTRILLDAQTAGVPWLVVEPAKREHRRLMTLRPTGDVHVWSAGVEDPDRGIPLRLDPMTPPEGTPVGTWLDGLLALFEASFTLFPPMPWVLRAGLQRVYEEAGWDLAGDVRGRPVALDNLLPACDAVIDQLGYAHRIASDVRAALRARLASLTEGRRGLLYGTGVGVPDAELFDRCTVIELDALPRAEDKAFAMGLLVLRLSCWRRFGPGQGPHHDLRHLLVLEEAHRLLRAPQGAADGESSRAHGVEQLTDLISEIRAYGEGVVLADQIPSRLAEDAVKNTDLKILHRTVSGDDRELLAASTLLDEEQSRHLGRLRRGEVVVYREPMDAPLLARVDAVEGYDTVPSDRELTQQALAAGQVEPKPWTLCRGCAFERRPCGATLAVARRQAEDPAHGAAWRRRALDLVTGREPKPVDTPTTPTTRCIRAASADRAAREVSDAMGLPSPLGDRLRQALSSGTSAGPVPPRDTPGPLAACGHCPAPCHWRPLGRRLASPDADWSRVDDTEEALHAALDRPTARLAAWSGRQPIRHLTGALYCVAAHELESSTPADLIEPLAAPLSAFLLRWRR